MSELVKPAAETQQTGNQRRSFFLRLAALAGVLLPLRAATGDTRGEATDRVGELEKQLASMQAHIGRLQDLNDIRKLQHAYGYYLDKCLYEEVVDLYADDGEVRFMGGVWKTKAGVRRLYVGTFGRRFADGKNGPVPGFLLDHPQLQEVIDVAPDRSSARARFRSMMQAGVHIDSQAPMARDGRKDGRHPRQWWEGGIYENEYVREDGIWKIRLLSYNPVWHADFDKGWAYTKPEYIPAYSETYPDLPNGPDELDPNFLGLWPKTKTVPFHYPHPVTGKPWS
ncbi:MAG: nuclear transport factor 2 family protein [Woeseiaceae bacterium]|nr:nuclear transport factor 2 family protein [Woeseiaceae bacterium]